MDMRSDETIRKAAVGKNDHRILAVVYRELVAAEACYHKSCYRNYTRNISFSGIKKEDNEYIDIPAPNSRGMRNCSTTLEPICYKILGL